MLRNLLATISLLIGLYHRSKSVSLLNLLPSLVKDCSPLSVAIMERARFAHPDMSGYVPIVRVDEVWLPILISVEDSDVQGVQ